MWPEKRQGLVGSPSLPMPNSRRRRAGGSLLPRFLFSQTFLLGACAGIALSWLFNQLALLLVERDVSSAATAQPVPINPPDFGGYHAIIIPAGGQHEEGPPPHVLARLERAVHLYETSAEPKPYVITTAWGTPHKPCPHDAVGFERHEAQDNAHYLISHGVPAASVLEESVSLETVGNAYFARVLHTDVRSLQR